MGHSETWGMGRDACWAWCKNLQTALAARQKARQEEANERVARQKSADTFNAEMRDATLAKGLVCDLSDVLYVFQLARGLNIFVCTLSA